MSCKSFWDAVWVLVLCLGRVPAPLCCVTPPLPKGQALPLFAMLEVGHVQMQFQGYGGAAPQRGRKPLLRKALGFRAVTANRFGTSR